MNDNFEQLMYDAGLTAQGCMDSMDQYDIEAIERFGRLIAKRCIDICEQGAPTQMTSGGAATLIKLHFGLINENI